MKVGSLFTGAGGLDLAVQMLWPDARLAWWSEVDEHASASFARHTDAPNLGDITQVDWSDVEPVDVIVGGFPCQDLSHAGKQGGINADRSGLWFHMLAAMNALQPQLALLENVAGIYTATGDDDELDVDRDPLDGRAARPARALDVVLGTLADDGWDAQWGDYRASDVGACHQRRRWFCVAYPNEPGLEGWHPGGVRQRRGQRAARAGHPQAGLTLLPTPRSTDGPHGGPGQVNGRGVPDSLPAIGALLPTLTVVDMGNNKSVDEWEQWTAEQKAKHGNGNGHGRSLSIEARLLPTPRSAADRASRASLTRDGHWSAPALAQAIELANGTLPREYESWDEVQGNQATSWGEYGPAIARWEAVTGRPAPAPTDDKGRLSAKFVEWMMGWPEGWTVGSRSQRLKQCGNGVVPLQAAHAYAQLLQRAAT